MFIAKRNLGKYCNCNSGHAQELTPEQLDLPGVRSMLDSFAWIRCAYSHFDNPAHHFLHALRPLTQPDPNCLLGFNSFVNDAELFPLVSSIQG